MKLKIQIKIHEKLVSELGGKFKAEDYIKSKIEELFSEYGISAEEVSLCIYIYICICYVYICIYIYMYIYMYIYIYIYMLCTQCRVSLFALK